MKNLLLGKMQVRTTPVAEQRIVISLPEGKYPALCTTEIVEHWRQRWPWRVTRVKLVGIELDTPIGIPGKGDNAWDMHDDAVYSFCCPAETVGEAIEKLKADVLSTRRRYGGADWRPDA